VITSSPGIAQITVAEPELTITKGVVSTDMQTVSSHRIQSLEQLLLYLLESLLHSLDSLGHPSLEQLHPAHQMVLPRHLLMQHLPMLPAMTW
jgi:hypothetical protein